MGRYSTADQVFRPLAASLAQQVWHTRDIRLHLEHRLPPALKRLAQGLADDLMAAFPASTAPDAKRIAAHLRQTLIAEPLLAHVKRTGHRPDQPVDPPEFLPIPAFADIGLPALTTPDALAEWLALPPAQLTRFSDLMGLSARTDTSFAPHYRHHFRPKSDGTLRLLEEPKPLLKQLQRRILHHMLDLIPAHPAAFGFCRGRNAAQGAAQHAGEQMVICFDLSAFFPSIPHHRVYGLFRRMGYPTATAQHLAGLCTALTPAAVLSHPQLAARQHLSTRHLPQGAPCSPALANLVAFGLDVRLAGLAHHLGARYTRYADDLTFSGDRDIARALQRAVPHIVRECGFHLNPRKTRLQPASGRQTVTGLVVNQHLNLPRPQYDQLKAIIHHLGRPDDPRRSNRAFLVRLSGQIAWLEQVNPVKGARLRDRLAEALSSCTAE